MDEAARVREPSRCGKKADKSACGRGDPDGSAAIRTYAQGDDPRRDRCCGSTARSAGRTPGVPRVDRLGPEAICGAAPGIEFWHICTADEHPTCCAQPVGNGSAFSRHEVLKQK